MLSRRFIILEGYGSAVPKLCSSNTDRAKRIMHSVPNGLGINRGGAKSMVLQPESFPQGGVYKGRVSTPSTSVFVTHNLKSNILEAIGVESPSGKCPQNRFLCRRNPCMYLIASWKCQSC